jgi:hypothetical protein
VNPPAVDEALPAVAGERSGRHERQVERSDRQRTFRRPERTARTARAHQNGLGAVATSESA